MTMASQKKREDDQMAAKKKHHAHRAHHAHHAAATNEELAELARHASELRDEKLVKLCGRALAGNTVARRECGRHIAAGRAIHALHQRRAAKSA
jgi:hypothetical protein